MKGMGQFMKVIIADDEKWVRAAIIKTIPFDRLGLTLMCEASNGIEALEACRAYKPDILVTDIKMPGITGLELIRELHDRMPEIKIIIISGYGEFEYAKEAMNYGITHYILKPVDEHEISQVLLKVKESILNERKQNEENNLIKMQYEKTKSLLLDKFLNQLVAPNCFTLEFIRNELKNFALSFDQPYFTVIIFLPGRAVSESGSSIRKCKIFIKRTMKRCLKAVTFTNTAKDYEIISVVNHGQSIDSSFMPEAFSLCISLYNKYFGGGLSVGVSTSAHRITRLPDLYRQSCEALQLKFWDDTEKVFYYEQGGLCDTLNAHIEEEILNDIALNIKTSECKPAISYADSIYNRLKALRPVRPELVKEFFWTFVQSITNRLSIQLSFIEYELLLTGIHPYERIKSAVSLSELISSVKEMLGHICAHYTQKNSTADENVIETAKKFIEDNFDKNLSLEQASRYVHLNPTYFSELFKKSTGMSFVDYKNLLRIENAKKLLTTTCLNIDKISGSLGYTDPKYFSKLFKKMTGKTPQDYKKGNT